MPPVNFTTFHPTYGVQEAEICNKALLRIGAELIRDTSEDTKQSRACRSVYTQTRDELLRQYPFNFAVKTVLLAEDAAFPFPRDQYQYAYNINHPVIINADTAAGSPALANVTIPTTVAWEELPGRLVTGPGIVAGTRIASATQVLLLDGTAVLDTAATALGADVNLTTSLPVLKILEVMGNPENIYDVVGAPDGRRILCDLVTTTVLSVNYLEMKYVEQVVNPALFDSMFIDALALRIASKIAVNLSQSPQLAAALQQEFAAIMQLAKNTTAEERQIDSADTWWTDRIGTEVPRAQARR